LLAADGVHAKALRSAFPTLTFPNHYTIVTGLYPDHHGIVNNRFFDPVGGNKFVYNDPKTTTDPAWWGATAVGWRRTPGQTCGDNVLAGSDVAIDGVRPEHWLTFDGKMSANARVDQVWRGLACRATNARTSDPVL